MINREWKTVTLKHYTNTPDAYGQLHKGTPTTSSIKMVIKLYSQSDVQNPQFVDVTDIGLTEIKTIVPGDEIEVDGKKYQVLLTIPSTRLQQVMLKKLW